MKYTAVIIFIFLFLSAGCRPPQPSGNSNQSPPPAPQTANLGPKDVLKAIYEASGKKDTAAIKNRLTKGSLTMLDDAAEAQGRTVEDILTNESGPFRELKDTREEKINGDTATVEVMNAITKVYRPMPLVKEDGEWKLAIDRYNDNYQKQATEDLKKTVKNPAPSAK